MFVVSFFRGENKIMFRKRILLMAALVAVSALMFTTSAQAGGACCCCPPAPIQTTLCVKPPCSCGSTAVCVCVPGCCTEQPTVCWSRGLLGRQVATYTWPCCGHQVKVVVNRRGDVKVR
jgi:hypothetical protein